MPLIDASWRSELHQYMGGVIKGLGGIPEKIGGVADHVHVLVGLKSTHCLADFCQGIKKGFDFIGAAENTTRREVYMAGWLCSVYYQCHIY